MSEAKIKALGYREAASLFSPMQIVGFLMRQLFFFMV